MELPALSEIKGIVIHCRFLVNSNLLTVNIPENICLECTILSEQGLEHPKYTKQLFNIDCMSAHIVRNKTNILLVQLDEVTAPDNVDLSQQPESQAMQVIEEFDSGRQFQSQISQPLSQMGTQEQSTLQQLC